VCNKQLKAYAVTAATRLAVALDIPTVDEAGAPGVYISSWSVLWVPSTTPRSAVAGLARAAMDAFASEDVGRRLEELGQTIPPPEQDGRSARRLSQGRDREMVADHKSEQPR
jgi:tripartite-type tricarboxylate transporter receptor subunit TctC